MIEANKSPEEDLEAWLESRPCSKCQGANDRYPNRYCRSCHNENARATRSKYSELSPEQRKKANARSYAHVYRDRGKIEIKPCEKCGAEKAEMHHSDYDAPLLVAWLCRECHLDLHSGENKNDKS